MNIGQMTEEERKAYEWALNQEFQSVAASHARALAKFIERMAISAKGDPECPVCSGSGYPDCNDEIYERGRESLADERQDRRRNYAAGFEDGSNS